jgi:hypothetical protein
MPLTQMANGVADIKRQADQHGDIATRSRDRLLAEGKLRLGLIELQIVGLPEAAARPQHRVGATATLSGSSSRGACPKRPISRILPLE